MTTEETWILDSALKGLRAERESIDRRIADLEARLQGRRTFSSKEAALEPKRKRRMSAATKKLLSQRLKAHWAKKRTGGKK